MSPPNRAARSTAAAGSVGLRYALDTIPGIRRIGEAPAFAYVFPDGAPVVGATHLARIRALAVPPAWTDVWIAPHPLGQATGRDAKGRKQYRYHQSWKDVRDETRFHRLTAFACVDAGRVHDGR